MFLHRTPFFQTQTDNRTPLGSSQGRQDLSPKISFHYHKKDGEEGVRAAVEKQVISTAAGEQKATWFWARKREEGPEGISERLTLRGWGACLCCSAEIEQTCLLGADADLKILLFRTILSISDTMTVSFGFYHVSWLSAGRAKFYSCTVPVAIAKLLLNERCYSSSGITVAWTSLSHTWWQTYRKTKHTSLLWHNPEFRKSECALTAFFFLKRRRQHSSF